jgi:hypothetical protein
VSDAPSTPCGCHGPRPIPLPLPRSVRTVGELREALASLPADMPLTIGGDWWGEGPGTWYTPYLCEIRAWESEEPRGFVEVRPGDPNPDERKLLQVLTLR